MYRLERVVGGGIIAPRRSSSAHLHRPWRATSQYAIAAETRRFRAYPTPMPRKADSDSMIAHRASTAG